MKLISFICRLLAHLKHPVSLPEDIAKDLGINLSNFYTTNQLILELTKEQNKSPKIIRLMQRDDVEKLFSHCLKKERFCTTTICSYFFCDGWLEFILAFDDLSKLRRIYIRHKSISNEHGMELPLAK